VARMGRGVIYNLEEQNEHEYAWGLGEATNNQDE